MDIAKEIAVPLAAEHLLPRLKKALNAVMNVPKDVADMKNKLDRIQSIIHDKEKKAADEEGNKAKVKQLVQTSFHMEDIIDECAIVEERQLRDDAGCVALPCKAVDFVKTKASCLHFAYMNEGVESEIAATKDKNESELTQVRVLGLTNVQQGFRNVLYSLINKLQHMEKLYIAAIDEHEVIDLNFIVSELVLQNSQLQKVRLVGRLNGFPNWVAKLQNLVMLSLSHSKLTDDPLGLLKDLPNLLCLSILYCAYEGSCLHFPNGGFPKLEQIIIRRLYKLNSIRIENGALPSLKKLKLVSISQLTEVPSGVCSLPKLEVFHAINMSNEFEENFHSNRGQRAQWIIEQVPFEIAASLAVDYLLPPLKKAVNSVMEVPKDVADMKDKLDRIQAIIHDVDKMAAAEEGNSHDGLKAKLKQLVETSFCMEDIADEYMIHEEKQLGDDPGCAALPCKAIDFNKEEN
ncbi:Disease resistance protein RPM1 [Glycine max]|nr:Disease resistance protein RPM1 [Glycine max]